MILFFDNVNLEVICPSGDLYIQVSPLIQANDNECYVDINVFKLHGTKQTEF